MSVNTKPRRKDAQQSVKDCGSKHEGHDYSQVENIHVEKLNKTEATVQEMSASTFSGHT